MKTFITDDFLLQSQTAKTLYHDFAKDMPIFDYHCHLIPQQIADDVQFENLTQIWLYGDHYKWRAMRSNGVNEKYCTGNASDYEKFQAWAQTVPNTMRNPLYHWTHLELRRPFGIEKILNADTEKEIYDTCSEKLQQKDFSARGIMRQMNVKAVCTTDDPADTLEHHQKIKDDNFEIKVLPTWRPDKGMATENLEILNQWIDKIAALTNIEINTFDRYIEAIIIRHNFFHYIGCRISDRGIETAYAQDYTVAEINGIFDKIRSSQPLTSDQQLKFKSAMLYEFALMDHAKGWTMQLHLGALRNKNSRMLRNLGPDTGFDSIGDFEIAKPLSKFLDRLDINDKLPKTIIYNLNPRDNELLATMIGNFQDGTIPGKMQLGSGWWFLDQRDGMQKQIEAISNLGLLSRFVGMLTDSRSFLSYPRHEYFRRILCDILACDIEQGLLPRDIDFIGKMVQNISYNNAAQYFGIDLS